jgi:hypothetical protein
VVAIELLEMASAMVAAADATGPQGRDELEGDLYRERHPDPVAERPPACSTGIADPAGRTAPDQASAEVPLSEDRLDLES